MAGPARTNDPSPNLTSQSKDPRSKDMMRIAVAGTGGLARIIGHYVHEETVHQLLFLSRTMQPTLLEAGYQVMQVDYDDPASLQYALMGVDVVISTVSGGPQIKLIDAAVKARVRRFAPAEFEGSPTVRSPGAGDPFDRGKTDALRYLSHYREWIESTVFVCGVFYERFAPGGLSSLQIGTSSGISQEGDYIMNIRAMHAQVPLYDSNGGLATICMTSVQDVGRFVVRALELPEWPFEIKMSGERMTVQALVNLVQQIRGVPFYPIQWHHPASLRSELAMAVQDGDIRRQYRAHALLATAEGRYDYAPPYFNLNFPGIEPVKFADWLARVWTSQ